MVRGPSPAAAAAYSAASSWESSFVPVLDGRGQNKLDIFTFCGPLKLCTDRSEKFLEVRPCDEPNRVDHPSVHSPMKPENVPLEESPTFTSARSTVCVFLGAKKTQTVRNESSGVSPIQESFSFSQNRVYEQKAICKGLDLVSSEEMQCWSQNWAYNDTFNATLCPFFNCTIPLCKTTVYNIHSLPPIF